MGEKVDVTRVLGRHAGSDRTVSCQLLSLVLFLTSGLTAHAERYRTQRRDQVPGRGIATQASKDWHGSQTREALQAAELHAQTRKRTVTIGHGGLQRVNAPRGFLKAAGDRLAQRWFCPTRTEAGFQAFL